jgi:hypothetical protein
MMKRFTLAFALIPALPGLALAQTQVAQLVTPSAARAGSIQAGVAAAVKGPVQRMADGVGEVLQSGRQIFMGDRIVSGPEASLQVLLLDQTVFTLGPDSEMVVDEFVYRPDGSGTVTASISKGTFRFVSGLVAKNRPSDMTIKVPTATIGIRGTMGGGSVGATTQIVLLGPGPQQNGAEFVGRLVVQNQGGSVALSRPGFGTTIAGFNQAPSTPFQFTPQQIGAMGGPTTPGTAPQSAGPGPGGAAGGPQQPAGSAQTINALAGQSRANASLSLGPVERANTLRTAPPEVTQAPPGNTLTAVTTWEQLRSLNTGSFVYTAANIPLVAQAASVGSGQYFMTTQIDLANRTTTVAFAGFYSLNGSANRNFSYTENNESYSVSVGNAAKGVFEPNGTGWDSSQVQDMPNFSVHPGDRVLISVELRNKVGTGGIAGLMNHHVAVTNLANTQLLIGQGSSNKTVVP